MVGTRRTMMIANQIFLADSIQWMLKDAPEKFADVIFADPPYNLQLKKDLWRPNMTQVDAVTDAWDQFDSFAEYDEFTREWLTAARRVMKDDATIWVSGTYHNIFRVGRIMQDLGFWLLNTVTWFKRNAMPNFRGTRLKNDVEFVIWAKKSESSRYTFNHHLMKQFNDGKQLGSVWDIPACGGAERLKDANGRKLHSTQKPEELLKRVILASSNPGDVVFDPFLGTGTTAAVAKYLNRGWCGVEKERIYFDAAQARIDAVQPLPMDHPLMQPAAPSRPPRVPFQKLLAAGYLQPGQVLYSKDEKHKAVIQKDGKLRANGYVGSIHQVGAQLKNTPSCNGWTHWYYEDQDTGDRQPIDQLRHRFRDTHHV
ncbi:MAG: hypothetical protein CUN56_03375 [Phototrophicales bacterium]|nr:MAG: hypothetical protein CUN56_03375 [Phototrophicales bacterium]